MNRRRVAMSAAVVALPLIGVLPGAAAAAEHRLSMRTARTTAITAAQPIVDTLAGDPVVRVTGCQRLSAARIDCRVLVTAAPSYECRARVVIRAGRRARLRDLACIG